MATEKKGFMTESRLVLALYLEMEGITLGEVLIRLGGLARYFYMVLEQEVLRWIIPPVKQLDLVLVKWIKL